ncbi:hypothetical protein ACFVT2_18125 [Streptomyces sp. NPDC058000]|uniref:hypothetical protein n=1 Tax=Streptomyces sp. NPDC058000 TaxID=3346299 RepID=UPI0036EE2453
MTVDPDPLRWAAIGHCTGECNLCSISGEPAEFLMLFAPGGAREGYFEGLGQVAGMSDQERADFFRRHDGFFADMAKGPAADSWEDRAALRRSFRTR